MPVPAKHLFQKIHITLFSTNAQSAWAFTKSRSALLYARLIAA